MNKIYKFSNEFCDSIIKNLSDKDKFILQYQQEEFTNDSNLRVQLNQPTDADGWDINHNKEIINEIINILNTHINNISEFHFCVQRLDVNKKSKSHTDSYDFTSVILLNDEFENGDLIIDNEHSNLKKGEFLIFNSNKMHYVEKITNGERYTLVGFINTKKKIEKTLL